MDTETIFFVIIMVLLGSVLLYAIAIAFRKPDPARVPIDGSVERDTGDAYSQAGRRPEATEVPDIDSIAFKKYHTDMMHMLGTDPAFGPELRNAPPSIKSAYIRKWWTNHVTDDWKIELERRARRATSE